MAVSNQRGCGEGGEGGEGGGEGGGKGGGGGEGGEGGEGSELQVVCGDARALLLLSPPFEYVHLDPFGT